MKRIVIKILILPILIAVSFCFNTINASEYLGDKTETRYDTTSGLLTGKANTICQTDDGYIWIGQYAGLSKYDSKQFFTITNYEDINLTSIVTLANYGNILLIGSEKGFFIRYPNNTFEKVKTDDSSLVVKDIKVIEDIAYIGTTSGLFRYDLKTKGIVRIVNESISRIAIKDTSNIFYLVGKEKVYKLGDTEYLIKDNVKSIFYYKNKIYAGTRNGHIISNDLTNNVIEVNILNASTTINDIFIKDDVFYLSCDAGLYIGKFLDNSIKKIKSYDEEYNMMEKVFFDYENNLWLASSALGVYKICQNEILDFSFEYGIGKRTTYAAEKYHGLTFIATDDGIYVVDEKNGYIEPIDLEAETNPIKRKIIYLYQALDNASVRDIEVYDDKIYFATQNTDGMLYYFDINETIENSVNYLLYDDLSQNQLTQRNAKDFRCLKAIGKYLFIGLDAGISRYDGANYSFKETQVYPLFFDYHDDDLYVVLNTIGVVKLSVSNFNTSNMSRLDIKNTYSTLKCMYYDGGVLFTDNNILYYFKDNEVKRINLDLVGSIVELVFINNKFYVCTEANVYIIDDLFNIKEAEILDSSNGLKYSLVANATGYYDSEGGYYYFISSSGLLKYDVNSKKDLASKVKRKIAIDSIVVDGMPVETDNFKISSEAKKLEINFSVLSYKIEQHYTIYYKLKGYDKDYQQIRANDTNTITYQNLEGGDYEFELYTIDFDGTRSANTLNFSFNKYKKITEYPAFWIIFGVLFTIIAIITSIFITKRTNRKKIKRSIERQNEYKKITIESIEAIARTIDAKDAYTNGHSKRVGIYSKEIAKALNLSSEEVDNIYYIALLHDIGKIAIPESILNKPGKLTDEEFEIMKSHTTRGGKILEGISTIPNIVAGAKYHHERYGGGGYPNGLIGEEIPFIARIICCADCYDTMATKRLYKEPYTKEKIISEFENCKYSQFDPKIADVVIQLIKEDKFKYGTEMKENK